jgi:rod shape-determining protein MreD
MAGAEQVPGIRPRATFGRRLDVAARHAFPMACTILLMLLTEAPIRVADQATLLPAVTFACVFFWTLFRPAAMPPPVVFIVGLLFDLLGYLPLGVGVLTLLVLHGLVLRWRVVLLRKRFLAVWLSFALLAAGGAILDWLLTILLSFSWMSIGPTVFEALLATAVFPALATLFIRAHHTVANPEHA